MNMNEVVLISYVTYIVGEQLAPHVIERLDTLVKEINKPKMVECSTVDALLAAMGKEGQKIEAIKQYRTLTGAGLRESKDAVERYWNVPVAQD